MQRFGWVGLMLLAVSLGAQGQGKPDSAMPAQVVSTAGQPVHLDVVVSGAQAAGTLTQADFTVLDAGRPQPLLTVTPLPAAESPSRVVILLDTANVRYMTVAFEREQVSKYLRAHEGQLAHQTALAILTDTGVSMQPGFSTDGNALAATLEKQTIPLRDIRRGAGVYGAEDRLSLGLNALGQLLKQKSTTPGSEAILIVSPGWPYLSGPNVLETGKQQDSIFRDVVAISNELRREDVTLYMIDPEGAGESVGRENYYREYLDGVTKPGKVDLADLSAQVLSVQSGGLVLNGSNDLAKLLSSFEAPGDVTYRISFTGATAEHPDEYHKLAVRVDKPGLTVRTRTGYYAEP